jgi:hypothetical protein
LLLYFVTFCLVEIGNKDQILQLSFPKREKMDRVLQLEVFAKTAELRASRRQALGVSNAAASAISARSKSWQ